MSDLVGIGAVISEFAAEFPDLTVSKVRFLEAQGLLSPIRTPSGYRRYSRADRERLRYILRTQRDHFLPLKVIGEHLDAMSRGLAPPGIVDPTPRPPDPAHTPGDEVGPGADDLDVRLTSEELLRESGLTEAGLADAHGQGLLTIGADGRYGLAELDVASAVAGLAEHGMSARHLRTIRLAADRHIGFVDQILQAAPVPEGRASANDAVPIFQLTRQLEGAIIAAHLRDAYRNSR